MKSFEKIIGYESIKEELYQIIDMFKNKSLYESMGAKLSKGILIYGDPGLGKTMLAEALIKECNVKTFIIKNNMDQISFFNEINNAFIEASKLERAIIFFDDLDKFSESKGENVADKIFVNIQTNIDSVKDKDILIVATLNDINKLPKSLKRSGRFDKRILVETPSNNDAAKIIEFYLKSKNVSKNLNFTDITKMISYKSCADLEKILNESAIYATFARKEAIERDDIAKAYCTDYYNLPFSDFKCSSETFYATCMHEAGHAVIAEALKEGSVGFMYVASSSNGAAQGFTKLCENFSRRPEHILIGLGGKASVELFHQGRCASNCSSDLDKVIRLVKGGISANATAGIGLIEIAPSDSESLKMRTEAVVQAEIEKYMFQVKDILLNNKEFVLKLADALNEKKFLFYSDIAEIRKSVHIKEAKI